MINLKEGVFLELGEGDPIIDLISRFLEVNDIDDPKDLNIWHHTVEALIAEMVIDRFKVMVNEGRHARRSKFEHALLVLQGGE